MKEISIRDAEDDDFPPIIELKAHEVQRFIQADAA
jgi:hypothetical protein